MQGKFMTSFAVVFGLLVFFVRIPESQQNKHRLCTYVANDVWDSVTRVHFSSLAEHAQSNVNVSQ